MKRPVGETMTPLWRKTIFIVAYIVRSTSLCIHINYLIKHNCSERNIQSQNCILTLGGRDRRVQIRFIHHNKRLSAFILGRTPLKALAILTPFKMGKVTGVSKFRLVHQKQTLERFDTQPISVESAYDFHTFSLDDVRTTFQLKKPRK